MLLFKSALWVGLGLFALLYTSSEYLVPTVSRTSADWHPARNIEVFRPTPPPPISELQPLPATQAAAIPIENEKLTEITKPVKIAKVAHVRARKSNAHIASAKIRKPKVYVARRATAPQRSFAYFRPQPFFFGWR